MNAYFTGVVPETFFWVGERLAVDLLNTVVVQGGQVRDLLATRRDAAAWAEAAGVARQAAIDPRELRAFREELRRGLRAWAATGRPGRTLISLLNHHLARDPQVAEVRIQDGRVRPRRRSTAGPRERLYGAVARSAAELLARGDPGRLRKCANPECRLMFYDVSKAGARRWCSMATCGAQAKVRTFRTRHTDGPRSDT